MNASRKPEPSSPFLESYMHELMSMSDDDILDGRDADTEKQRASQRIAAARIEASRRRLQAAKERVKQQPESEPGAQRVSVDEARVYIRQAANDGQVTLAARQLNEMSDADAMRLYGQLKRLQDEQGDEGDAE
ncbi:hypothetical protein SAMN05414139_05453 [Burkholderia sp. D7]|nr:hypothetical protein SAMN05414139_05453 [Burkholderia sp. D7]